MWGWLSCDKPTGSQALLISKTTAVAVVNDDDHHHHSNSPHPTATIAMILTTWVRGRRIRYVFIVLCSPLLIPLLCAAFPIICAIEICSRFFRRRSDRKVNYDDDDRLDCDDMRRCEEGEGCGGGGERREMRLLQRYLEDQLVLVLESVYECGELGFGDWDYGDGDGEFLDISCSNILCPD